MSITLVRPPSHSALDHLEKSSKKTIFFTVMLTVRGGGVSPLLAPVGCCYNKYS